MGCARRTARTGLATMARMSASCVATACCSVPMSASQKQTEPVESPVVTVAAWAPLGKRQKRRCRGLCHQSTPTAQSRHYKCADIPQERRRPHQRRCLGRRRHRHAADDATCISTKDNADHRWCDEHNFMHTLLVPRGHSATNRWRRSRAAQSHPSCQSPVACPSHSKRWTGCGLRNTLA